MLEDILSAGFAELGLPLDGAALERYRIYYEFLAETNKVMNLTAISGEEDVARLHFLDSAALLTLADFSGKRVVDVGTGAGFPGMPLLILRPDLQITFLDALNKRILFLEDALKRLGLTAATLHARAEDAGQNPRFRERFDAALTRAVSGLPVLCELTLPLVKIGGVSIAYKGDSAEELAASAHALTVLHATAQRIAIPSDYGARELVILTKTGATPKQYPRKAGTPFKSPL